VNGERCGRVGWKSGSINRRRAEGPRNRGPHCHAHGKRSQGVISTRQRQRSREARWKKESKKAHRDRTAPESEGGKAFAYGPKIPERPEKPVVSPPHMRGKKKGSLGCGRSVGKKNPVLPRKDAPVERKEQLGLPEWQPAKRKLRSCKYSAPPGDASRWTGKDCQAK